MVACCGGGGRGGWGFSFTNPTKNNLPIPHRFTVEIFHKDVLGSTVWFGLPVRAISRHNAVLHEAVRPGVIVFRFKVPNIFSGLAPVFFCQKIKKILCILKFAI
jgi:hypothetical protein